MKFGIYVGNSFVKWISVFTVGGIISSVTIDSKQVHLSRGLLMSDKLVKLY